MNWRNTTLMTLVSLLLLVNVTYAQKPDISVNVFKSVYSIGMTVGIFGEVASKTQGNTVKVIVKNPSGAELKNANVNLDDQGTFGYEFLLENNSAIGVYTIEASYGSKKATTTFEVKEKATLQISASKTKFSLGDNVMLSGKVAPKMQEEVKIKIYNPENKVWNFVTVSPNKISADGTFTVDAGELSTDLSIVGKYNVEASYAENTAEASMTFDVVASTKVTAGNFMLVDQSNQPLKDIFVGQQVMIQADVRNNLMENLQYSYFVLITDRDGITVSLSWVAGELPASYKIRAAQSWIPAAAGEYRIQVFVWKSVTEPEILGKVLEQNVTVAA